MVPTKAALVEQVVRLVDIRLLDPLEILLAGDAALDTVRGLIGTRAEDWAELMLDGEDGVAVGTIVRLVASLYPSDGPFEPPVEWWSTPIGQVLALRVGHPTAQAVSYPVAGAMLGITRQGVYDLIARGKLARHPDGGVLPASIRDRLRGEGRDNRG
ncbi:MAG TPA: hypothetical protein VHX38_36090 [Pseudonocardiaceae bacterium]|jgi:hypothetical protein|nr:hypothetical protein [Pseudonocardiaceae bacterium]